MKHLFLLFFILLHIPIKAVESPSKKRARDICKFFTKRPYLKQPSSLKIPYNADSKEKRMSGELEGHQSTIITLAYAAGQLASTSYDKTIRIWDLATQRTTHIVQSNKPSNNIHFFNEHCIMLAKNTKIKVKDLRMKTIVPLLCPPTQSTATNIDTFSCHTNNIAVGYNDRSITCFDIRTSSFIRNFFTGQHDINALTWLSGNKLAAGLSSKLKIWDIISGNSETPLKGRWVNALAVASTTFVSATDDGTISVWNPSNMECSATLEGHTASTGAVAYINDTTLASASDDATLCTWDLATNLKTGVINHEYAVTAVTSVNPLMIASGASDAKIRLWDIHKQQGLDSINITDYIQ